MKKHVAAVAFFIIMLYLAALLIGGVFSYSEVKTLLRVYGPPDWGWCYGSMQRYNVCIALSAITLSAMAIFFILKRFDVNIILSLLVIIVFVWHQYVVTGM